MPRLIICDEGAEVPYRPMLDKQRHLAQEIIDAKVSGRPVDKEYLLLLEHSHVYTLGRRGHAENMLLPASTLAREGVEYVHVDRGGDITYHGPGQLVAYPIIDLESHRLGVKAYVDVLEATVQRLLKTYGIEGTHVEGATGVWLEPGTPRERKICAIGIHCSRFVTTHGIGLNVNTDLARFAAIHPCGFIDKGVTSIEREIGHKVPMGEVKERFASIFASILGT